jgi:hypothetical protein
VLTVRRPKRTSMQSNICSPSSNATYGVGKHSAPCWLVVVGVEGETCRKKYVFFRGLHTLPHFGGSTSLTYWRFKGPWRFIWNHWWSALDETC